MKLVLIFSFLLITSVMSENILIMMAAPSPSHKRTMMPLAEGLAERGHSVTIVSASREKTETRGIAEIIPKDLGKAVSGIGMVQVKGWFTSNPMFVLPQMTPVMMDTCAATVKDPEVQEILDGKRKYDLAIFDMLFSECLLGIAGKLNLPFVYMSPNLAFSWVLNNLGIPSPTSFCPLHTMKFTDQMSFWERLQNFLLISGVTLVREHYVAPQMQSFLENELRIVSPSLLEVEKNVSFILTNDHLLSRYPRPEMPNMKAVGGMHCRKAQPLPQDMDNFISGAGKHGFIFFSLGSIFPPSKMSENQRKTFLEVFSRLPQRVLWKWDTEEMPDLPSNVRLYKWLPQQDLLGHPACRLFISHGGLLSIQEATYHGVPILGIPGAADQFFNMNILVSDGTGLQFDWNTLSVEDILQKINTIMTDPSFHERVADKRNKYRDEMVTAKEEAIFWLEYVLRHKGAAHLRSGGRYLNTLQLYQVDVILFIVGVLLLFILVLCMAMKCLSTMVRGSGKTEKKTSGSTKQRKFTNKKSKKPKNE